MKRLLTLAAVITLFSACYVDLSTPHNIEYIVENQTSSTIYIITPNVGDADTSWISPDSRLSILNSGYSTEPAASNTQDLIESDINDYLSETIIFNDNTRITKDVGAIENWSRRDLDRTNFYFVTFTATDNDF